MSLELDSVLHRLLLEQEYGTAHGNSLREWAMDRLSMHGEVNEHVDQYVRLRIALSLCPPSALTHSKSERLSRQEKIESHLVKHDLAMPAEAKQLATVIDRVISNWLTGRADVSGFRGALVSRDGSLCSACHVDLSKPAWDATSVVSTDPYKLTWAQPERCIAYTVDHKAPVSKFGTNDINNLEILCRYCNEGKEDGAPLLLKHEVELATSLPIDDPSVANALLGKSSRLVYRVLKRDNFRCLQCASQSSELTVRKVADGGLAVMSNLRAICYGCMPS